MAAHANALPWCATFIAAGAAQIGLRLPDGANTASTYVNEIAFKRAGRLSTKPRVGSVFFVYFPSMGRVGHTGLVWKVAGGNVHTIEGNSNASGGREGLTVVMRVRPAHRATGAVGIRSYGMPHYGEDIMDAKDFARIEQIIDERVPSAEDVAAAVMGKLGGERVIPNLGLQRGAPDAGRARTFVENGAQVDRKLDILIRLFRRGPDQDQDPTVS